MIQIGPLLLSLIIFSFCRDLYLAPGGFETTEPSEENDCTVKTNPCTSWPNALKHSEPDDVIILVDTGNPQFLIHADAVPFTIEHGLTFKFETPTQIATVFLFPPSTTRPPVDFFHLTAKKSSKFRFEHISFTGGEGMFLNDQVTPHPYIHQLSGVNFRIYNMVNVINAKKLVSLDLNGGYFQTNSMNTEPLFDLTDTPVTLTDVVFNENNDVFSFTNCQVIMHNTNFTKNSGTAVRASKCTLDVFINSFGDKTPVAYDLSSSTMHGEFQILNGASLTAQDCNISLSKSSFVDNAVVIISRTSMSLSSSFLSRFYFSTPLRAFDHSSLYLFNCEVSNNQMASIGGAVIIDESPYDPSSSLYIENCLFLANTVTHSDGGAIVFHGETMEIYNSQFFNNTAQKGGGIYVSTMWPKKLRIEDCLFEYNFADINGGAAFFLYSHFERKKDFLRLKFVGNDCGESCCGIDFAGTIWNFLRSDQDQENSVAPPGMMPPGTIRMHGTGFNMFVKTFDAFWNMVKDGGSVRMKPEVVGKDKVAKFEVDPPVDWRRWGYIIDGRTGFAYMTVGGHVNSFVGSKWKAHISFRAAEPYQDVSYSTFVWIEQNGEGDKLIIMVVAFVFFLICYVVFEVVFGIIFVVKRKILGLGKKKSLEEEGEKPYIIIEEDDEEESKGDVEKEEEEIEIEKEDDDDDDEQDGEIQVDEEEQS